MSAADLVHRRMATGITRLWAAPPGSPARLLGLALTPAAAAFRAAVYVRGHGYRHGWLRSRRAGLPVVSVGNLTVGGEGKTPFAAFLVHAFLERGVRPAVLHGGYGDDEPALHRTWHPDVPVYVGRDRSASAARAAAAGAQLVILDDGFQHRRLARDLDIVLVSVERWRQRPRLLPAGPWRESPRALARADVIVVIRRGAGQEEAVALAVRMAEVAPRVPIVRAALTVAGWSVAGEPAEAPEGPAVAVAGIALPEQFAASARAAGADVERLIAFPDHHAYSRADAEHIEGVAAGRPIVTTEKDAVKLASLVAAGRLRVLRQTVTIDAGAPSLDAALDAVARA